LFKRDKAIKRIQKLQKILFIAVHVESEKELEKRNDDGLKRYLQAHEILYGETKL
jgi:hypothetical protein|tara:strand:+ start:11899 stop:12063 length:165 start_codon:yes stop_codon:yes gene_type:complete